MKVLIILMIFILAGCEVTTQKQIDERQAKIDSNKEKGYL